MATNVDSEWEDVDDGGEWEDVAPQPAGPKPTPFGVAMQMAQDQMSLTPTGLLNTAYEKVKDETAELGDYYAKELPTRGVVPLFGREPIKTSPGVAKAVGGLIKYTPDIVTMFGAPVEAAPAAAKAAVPLARRALGFQKSFLKTPFARGQATRAAETALEEGVIPYSGNPTTMFERASELASKTGRKIGGMLEKAPANLQQSFDDLEALRPQLTQGMSGGVYEGANTAINRVQENILELVGKAKSARDINKVKSRLAQSINYLGDLASQSDNKEIQTTLANSIREMVKSAFSPEEFTEFLQNQKLYGAASLMMKGLNNEIAGQMGNRATSLLSMIPATGQLAAGNLPGAAATLGLGEMALRRGAGTAARIVQDVASPLQSASLGAATTAGGMVGGPKKILKKKTLTKQKAAEYLDRANGDYDKAMEYAEKDGY